MIKKKDYQSAVDSQGACNLSGIVHSFSEILPRIWEEANSIEEGTDWINRHPICVLFAEQIKHLSTGITYFDAYQLCGGRAKEDD